MRPGRDFWIDAVDIGKKEPYRRIWYRGGGCGGATKVEAALWDRLASEKLLPRKPRWYFAAIEPRAVPPANGGDEGGERC